jgi:hypothetical protein
MYLPILSNGRQGSETSVYTLILNRNRGPFKRCRDEWGKVKEHRQHIPFSYKIQLIIPTISRGTLYTNVNEITHNHLYICKLLSISTLTI